MKTKIKYWPVFILCLIFGLIAFTKPVSAQNKDQKNTNNKTKIIIEYKLIKKDLLDNNNLKVNVDNKTITLSGTVPTINAKKKVACIAKNVNENYNYKVVNEINIADSNLPDSVVTQKVLKRIWDNAFYNVFNYVTASDSNGVVTLYGWVSEPWNKTNFQKDAEKIAGVKSIKNEIKTTFGPGFLGYRIERMVYENPASSLNGLQYFSNPPVHIIVDNGTVILAGNVSSSAISNWVEDLVIFRTNAIGVKNYLKVNNV